MSSISTSTDGGYSYYQKQLGELEDELKADAKRSRETQEAQAQNLEKNYRHSAAKHDRDTEETVQSIRDSANERVMREREAAREEVDRAKSKMYDRTGRVSEEIAFERKRADEGIMQAREELDRVNQKAREAKDVSTEKQVREAEERSARAIELQTRSHEAEVNEVRGRMRDLLQAEKEAGRERANSRVDARAELENESRARETIIRNQYQAELEKAKRDSDNSERHYSALAESAIREKEAQFADATRRTTADHHHDTKSMQENFERAVAQQKAFAEAQSAANQRTLEMQAKKMSDERDHVLMNQAKAYQETMKNQKADDNEKINRLQHQLYQQMTSSDGMWVSPAAEAAMDRRYGDEFDKKLRAETERDTNKTDALQKDYSQRFLEAQQEQDSKTARLVAQYNSQAHQDRRAYMEHIHETELDHHTALKNRDLENERHTETLTRSSANQLEQQRRDYETMLNQVKTDAQERLTTANQDAEFKFRMAQREFTVQQNQLIRDYDKKLQEQKTSYEDQISELKNENIRLSRDGEKRTKQLLEEQSKGYEQRIAQMEFQAKERERLVSENYQDQMEKLKRSNALLVQKKG